MTDIDSILGCFLDVAPLSCPQLAKLSLEDALSAVQSRQLTAFDHAHEGISRGTLDSVLRFQSYPFSVALPASLRSWRGRSQIESGDFDSVDIWHFPLNLVIISGTGTDASARL